MCDFLSWPFEIMPGPGAKVEHDNPIGFFYFLDRWCWRDVFPRPELTGRIRSIKGTSSGSPISRAPTIINHYRFSSNEKKKRMGLETKKS